VPIRQAVYAAHFCDTDHIYNRPYGRNVDGLSTCDPWEPTSQIMCGGACYERIIPNVCQLFDDI